MSARTKGIIYAISAAIIWGLLAISLKVTLDYVPAITIVWVRFVVAFTMLWIILYVKERAALQVLRKPPIYVIVAAMALAINYSGYIKGLELTTPSNAQIVIQLAPLLLIVVGLVVYKEKINLGQAIGFVVAIIGFGLFYRDQISQLLTSPDNYNLGVAWVIGAALAWVIFASLQKSLVQKFHAQGLNLVIYLVPAILMIPLADFATLSTISWKVWGLLLFLGVNTLLAYGAIAEAFRYIPANKVGIIVTLNPIITIATMALLGQIGVNWIQPERISINGLMGAALIITGVIITIVVQKKSSDHKVVAGKWKLGFKR
jgi:drug/metabolite transporter (DMT)-like permease